MCILLQCSGPFTVLTHGVFALVCHNVDISSLAVTLGNFVRFVTLQF